MTGKGATIDIGAWLRGLSLGQYAATFRKNDIDDTILPSLTAEDLKDLGIETVGHRRKLLERAADRQNALADSPRAMRPVP
jgi:hypothetical protein